MGEHDYVRAVLDELGAEQRFWKLRMRPGAPVGFGLLGGNPVDRPAGQPGEHDGDLRAVRPAGDPEDVGQPLPFRRAVSGAAGRADHASSRGCSTSCAAVVTEGRTGRRPGSPAPRAPAFSPRWCQANALLVIPEGQFETPAGHSPRMPWS